MRLAAASRPYYCTATLIPGGRRPFNCSPPSPTPSRPLQDAEFFSTNLGF